MAVVETLEVRFQASMGNLGVQIGGIISKLNSLNGASAVSLGAFAKLSVKADGAVSGLNAASVKSAQSQQRLASKLKKTSNALKNVSSAAKKAVKGIGLHRMDEVNLTGDQKKTSSGGGGRSGSSGSGGGSAAEVNKTYSAVSDLYTMLKKLPGLFSDAWKKIGGAFSGLWKVINGATGGLLGKLKDMLKNAAVNAGSAFTEKFGSVLQAGKAGVADGAKALAQAAGTSLGSSSGAAAAGKALVNRFSSAIGGGRAAAKEAALSVAVSASFTSGNAVNAAKSAGANLSQGFANGISSKLSAVKNSVSKIVNSAVSRVKNILKIASPSRVTFSLGGYFGEGFADGILDSVQLAENGARMLSNGAAGMLNIASVHVSGGETDGLSGMMRAAVDAALGGTNIVIPLNVDGIRLGEASIRGINSVTRSTGKLLLEI